MAEMNNVLRNRPDFVENVSLRWALRRLAVRGAVVVGRLACTCAPDAAHAAGAVGREKQCPERLLAKERVRWSRTAMVATSRLSGRMSRAGVYASRTFDAVGESDGGRSSEGANCVQDGTASARVDSGV